MALAAADDHIFKYDGALALGAQADGLAVPQAEKRTLRLRKMQMARRDDDALGKLDLTLMPSLNESVMAISTCVALRSGPSTRTLASWPFGPTMVTCSVQAYCPGWDSMRNTVS